MSAKYSADLMLGILQFILKFEHYGISLVVSDFFRFFLLNLDKSVLISHRLALIRNSFIRKIRHSDGEALTDQDIIEIVQKNY
ncbi:hypothetical protein BpHYR1_050232 [Brachionus plicatilis]|uniref:Uncharacterized protein n=1 Tax=Brachionus plicatilis TaxID=10195 RepID=A0A3M7RJY3_BRAPC|nr:hypothetical protein BpHYR1_050232 [Brachionus plicatilis]